PRYFPTALPDDTVMQSHPVHQSGLKHEHLSAHNLPSAGIQYVPPHQAKIYDCQCENQLMFLLIDLSNLSRIYGSATFRRKCISKQFLKSALIKLLVEKFVS
ncbi:hypothetical protein STEG23_031894, partial [Scotinomys teguina]